MAPRPIFFTHVMKTGGISVGEALRSGLAVDRCFPARQNDQSVADKIFTTRLLGMPESERRRLDLISVHQPAWVAFEAAPWAVTATVLRDPVERTVSHLRHIARMDQYPDDIEEIWADEGWRTRLADHQTQIFSLVPEDYESGQVRDRGVTIDDVDRGVLAAGLQRFWTTGIPTPIEVDEARFDRAVETIDRFDVVGTTSDLDGFLAALGVAAGRTLPPVGHRNRAPDTAPVPARLIDAITRATRHDRRLVDHVVGRRRLGPGAAG